MSNPIPSNPQDEPIVTKYKIAKKAASDLILKAISLQAVNETELLNTYINCENLYNKITTPLPYLKRSFASLENEANKLTSGKLKQYMEYSSLRKEQETAAKKEPSDGELVKLITNLQDKINTLNEYKKPGGLYGAVAAVDTEIDKLLSDLGEKKGQYESSLNTIETKRNEQKRPADEALTAEKAEELPLAKEAEDARPAKEAEDAQLAAQKKQEQELLEQSKATEEDKGIITWVHTKLDEVNSLVMGAELPYTVENNRLMKPIATVNGTVGANKATQGTIETESLNKIHPTFDTTHLKSIDSTFESELRKQEGLIDYVICLINDSANKLEKPETDKAKIAEKKSIQIEMEENISIFGAIIDKWKKLKSRNDKITETANAVIDLVTRLNSQTTVDVPLIAYDKNTPPQIRKYLEDRAAKEATALEKGIENIWKNINEDTEIEDAKNKISAFYDQYRNNMQSHVETLRSILNYAEKVKKDATEDMSTTVGPLKDKYTNKQYYMPYQLESVKKAENELDKITSNWYSGTVIEDFEADAKQKIDAAAKAYREQITKIKHDDVVIDNIPKNMRGQSQEEILVPETNKYKDKEVMKKYTQKVVLVNKALKNELEGKSDTDVVTIVTRHMSELNEWEEGYLKDLIAEQAKIEAQAETDRLRNEERKKQEKLADEQKRIKDEAERMKKGGDLFDPTLITNGNMCLIDIDNVTSFISGHLQKGRNNSSDRQLQDILTDEYLALQESTNIIRWLLLSDLTKNDQYPVALIDDTYFGSKNDYKQTAENLRNLLKKCSPAALAKWGIWRLAPKDAGVEYGRLTPEGEKIAYKISSDHKIVQDNDRTEELRPKKVVETDRTEQNAQPNAEVEYGGITYDKISSDHTIVKDEARTEELRPKKVVETDRTELYKNNKDIEKLLVESKNKDTMGATVVALLSNITDKNSRQKVVEAVQAYIATLVDIDPRNPQAVKDQTTMDDKLRTLWGIQGKEPEQKDIGAKIGALIEGMGKHKYQGLMWLQGRGKPGYTSSLEALEASLKTVSELKYKPIKSREELAKLGIENKESGVAKHKDAMKSQIDQAASVSTLSNNKNPQPK